MNAKPAKRSFHRENGGGKNVMPCLIRKVKARNDGRSRPAMMKTTISPTQPEDETPSAARKSFISAKFKLYL